MDARLVYCDKQEGKKRKENNDQQPSKQKLENSIELYAQQGYIRQEQKRSQFEHPMKGKKESEGSWARFVAEENALAIWVNKETGEVEGDPTNKVCMEQ